MSHLPSCSGTLCVAEDDLELLPLPAHRDANPPTFMCPGDGLQGFVVHAMQILSQLSYIPSEEGLT